MRRGIRTASREKQPAWLGEEGLQKGQKFGKGQATKMSPALREEGLPKACHLLVRADRLSRLPVVGKLK